MASTHSHSQARTYWCHPCDMSVSILVSSDHPPLCPHCRRDFVEEMDFSSASNPNPNPSPSASASASLHRHYHHLLDLDLDPSADFIDRFYHHLADSAAAGAAAIPHRGPAAKASVEAIPTVKITAALLAADALFCAVCKDEFVVDVEAKQLPCSHIYHFDCILPWLAHHNSCPLCRFSLPTDEAERKSGGGGGGTGVRSLWDEFVVVDEDDEEEDDEEEGGEVGEVMVETTLLRIQRRHRRIARTLRRIASSSSSPTRMAQAETSSVGPGNSGETVSSCPVVQGATSRLRSGRLGGGVNIGGRLDEDGDAAISEFLGGPWNY